MVRCAIGMSSIARPLIDAAARLRALGHEVFSPAEHDLDCGYDFTGCEGTQAELDAAGFDFRKMLADDLAWICRHAEALVVLDGWETSMGTTAEIGVARALKITVITLENVLAMAA